MAEFSKIFILLGIVLILIGVFFHFGARFPYLGNLPLDFKYEKENFKFYFPFGTSILISILLSFLFYFIRKL